MEDTWGIPGPAFLGIFVLLLLGAALVAPLALRALDRRVARADGDTPAPDVTVEDLALLAGGQVRLIHAAIARLVEAGVLRVGHDRSLGATGRPAIGELDEAVLDAVTAYPTTAGTTVTTMRMRDAPVVRDLQAAAQRRGLFHDPAAVTRRKNLAFAVVGAVEVLGLARLAAGIARGAPIVLLVILIVFGAFAALSIVLFSVRRPTLKGRATLAAAQTAVHRPSWSSEREPGTVMAGALGVAGLVAVGGFAMYPDAQLSTLLAAPSGGGGGSDGGGSSCGGGGGGCGG